MTDLPPVWVVSLERAVDRRAFVQQAFHDVGIPFEVFSAVDGRALSERDRAEYSSRRAFYEYGRDLERGMFGASLSHLRVLERMVREGLDELAVFEDDVRPAPELGDLLRARDELPEDCDVLTLNSLFGWAGPTRIGSAPVAGRFWVVRYARTPMGLQGYLIRRAAAERVLAVGFPVALPPDEVLFRPHPAGLGVYGVEPSPLTHEEFPSEIRAPLPPLAEHGALASVGLASVRLAGRARRRLRGHPRRATSDSRSDQRRATTESS